MQRKNKWIGWGILIFYFLFASITYGHQKPIDIQKQKDGTYQVYFEEGKGMISRDGSYAVPIYSREKITKPGIYYLTIDMPDDIFYSKKIIIPYKETKDSWKITSEKQLEEIIKCCLDNFDEKTTFQFMYGSFTIEQMNSLLQKYVDKVINIYPSILFEGYTIRMKEGKSPKVEIDWGYPINDKGLLRQYQTAFNKEIENVIGQKLAAKMKVIEREKVVFKYIIDRMRYIDESKATEMVHSAYGAIVDGKAVCGGYAKSFMYLCNSVGIPTSIVLGQADTGYHAWNMVQLDNAYYHVDTTWADQEYHIGMFYDYFNEQDSYMTKTHEWNKTMIPKASDTKYTFPSIIWDKQKTYKINNPLQWIKTKKDLKKYNIQEATLVFENKIASREKIISELVEIANRTILVEDVIKDNYWILSFKVK